MSQDTKVLKFDTPVQKKGWIQRRGDTLKRWSKKSYEIENNILRIGDDESFKNIRIFNLCEFALKSIDKLDKRFSVTLVGLHGVVKGKIIYLGDDNEAPVREIFEKLLASMEQIKQNGAEARSALLPTGQSPKKANTQLFSSDNSGFAVPEDYPSWVQEVVSSQDLEKDDALESASESSGDWKLVHSDSAVRIFQNGNLFRLFGVYPKIKPVELLQLLIDLDTRQQWDDTMESAKSISDSASSQIDVIHRVYKPYGQLTKPSESYATRVIFNSAGKFFVLEKSPEDNEEIPKPTEDVARLDIDYLVYKVSLADEGSKLSLYSSVQVQEGGNSDANTSNVLELLKNISKLQSIPINDIIGPDARDDFDKFLLAFRSQQGFEESKDDEDLGSALEDKSILKELHLESTGKQTNQELAGRLERMKNGEIIRACVDPAVKYTEITEELRSKKVTDKPNHWLFGNDFRREPTVGIEVLNQEWIDSQKKVVTHIIKGMGRNLLEGKSIMNMSLPIAIFSKDTILQRAAKTISYAPVFLQKAAEISDPLEQFKQAVTFYFSTLHFGIEQQKPFNPILGETYQGLIAGVPITLEQVSHHPPVSALHYQTDKYFLYGSYCLEAQLGANSATAAQRGRINVKFSNTGNEVSAIYPLVNLGGILMGKRSFYWSKKLKVFDAKNGYYCEIHCYPDEKGLIGGFFSKKKDTDVATARGKIWRVKKEFAHSLWDKKHKKEPSFDEKKDAIETIATVNGNWIESLEIDGKKYWSLQDYRPYELVDLPSKALPSDSVYRQDLQCRILGADALGQEWKEKLENLQRADRKLRASKGGKKK